MKPKKKSITTLAFAVIITIISTIAACATTPKIENTDFTAILQGNAQFFYVSEGTAEPKSINDVPSLFDPYDDYMKIWSFAVLDLDGDGNTEVILTVFGTAGDMGGCLILHQINDDFYSYTADYRTLMNLKTDATFSYSDPTGAIETGTCAITAFTETGYTIDKITYAHGADGEWDTFVVNHQSATEEEYQTSETKQAEKADTTWHDFTAENIKSEL